MKRLALVLGALGAALLLAAPAEATFPGAAGKIAFDTTRDGDFEIYVMDPDGTDYTNISNSGGTDDSDAAWSADGKQIAYHRSGDIWVMNADGSDQHEVVTSPDPDYKPTWSPDSQRIAFTSLREGNRDIYAVDANGLNLNEDRLTTDPADDEDPSWSPDGSTIIFHRKQFGDYDIWRMNPNGTAQVAVHDTGSGACSVFKDEQSPDWSPDGRRIAFHEIDCGSGGGQGGASLGSMRANGTDRVIYGAFDGIEPAWAPNVSGQDGGTYRFAWGTPPSFGDDIYVGDTFGGTNLTGVSNGSRPSWQPLYQVPNDVAGATILYVELVPLYRETISATQCTARGGTPKTHAAPLSLTSCDPPRFLPGTVAAFGVQARGSANISTTGGNPLAPPDEADQTIIAELSDLRSGSALGDDYNPNSTGPDITFASKLRITDTQSGTTQGDPATVSDLDFRIPIDCVRTIDRNIGATCNGTASANGITPGMLREGKNTIVQMNRIRVRDSGMNGIRGDSDDRDFAMQGQYLP